MALLPRGSAEPGGERPVLSVVVPCANEEAVLPETNLRLIAALEAITPNFEIIYVDDGSTDSTPDLLREMQLHENRIRAIRFSRNFGHQLAITAGLEHARGDAVVIIDADLQDPPEVIREFFQKWLDGHDVAYGVRVEREGETAFKRGTAKLFYRFISHLSDTAIPLDTGDFRLMDRRVVDALLSMPERDRFVRGMVSWLGFSQVAVPYRRAARFAGDTKFSLFKMMRFATDGIVSFSILPLRMATWIGFAASGIALVEIAVALFDRFFSHGLVRGWTSTVIAIWFVGGVQLICMGIIGEYVGRIYGESKRRPLYVVRERMGFEATDAADALRPRVRMTVGGR
jgi:dolichol-phosphate mannosyltransferase